MTYNPRIRNKKNNRLQVTGSILTGSVADFNIVSGSTITGSTAYISTLTVDVINVSTPINTTASFALTAGLAQLATTASYALTAAFADNATTASYASNAATASYALTASVADNATSASYADNALTASYALTAGLAQLATTASYAANADTLDGLDSTAFVQSSNLSNVAVTSITAGVGLNASDSTGSVTLDVDVAEIVTITGSQVISGQKSFTSNLSGTTAEFTAITASFSGNGGGLTGIPNGALQNSSITINGSPISLGGTINVGDITDVTAGTNLTGGGSSGSVTISLSSSITGLDVVQTTALTASSTYVQGDLVVNGTASIGQLNTLTQQSLVIGDKYITILSGAADHVSLDGSGFLWGSGSTGPTVDELGANAHIRYRNSLDALEIFPGLYVSGGTTLSTISGTVAQFTTLTASLVGLTNVNSALVSTDALATNVTGVNSDFDLAVLGNKHTILVDAVASDITGTLPSAAVAAYRQYVFKKIDATENAMSIAASGSETIDGESKVDVVAQYETVSIVSDGISKWYIV